MGRTTAVADDATWAIAQTAQRVRERLVADGVFCDADANAFAGFQDALRLTLRHAHGDRMAETIKRTGDLTEHVIRKDREFKRDMERIVTDLLTRPDNVTDLRQAA
jgi:hypothetical protein